MEAISLVTAIVIALISAGAINVIRKVLSYNKTKKKLEKIKEKANKDNVIDDKEKAAIDKAIDNVKKARNDMFKSILALLSAMLKTKLDKKAKPSDLIDKINSQIK